MNTESSKVIFFFWKKNYRFQELCNTFVSFSLVHERGLGVYMGSKSCFLST